MGDGGVPDVNGCGSSMEPLQLLFRGDEEEAGAGTSDDGADGAIVSVAATVVAAEVGAGWMTVDAPAAAAAKLGDDDSNELLDTVVDVFAVVAATKQGYDRAGANRSGDVSNDPPCSNPVAMFPFGIPTELSVRNKTKNKSLEALYFNSCNNSILPAGRPSVKPAGRALL